MVHADFRGFAGVLALVTAMAVGVSAQGDRWEKTVPFTKDKSTPLGAVVGPVKVPTLKVVDLGRGYGRGGFGPGRPASEASTTLRFAFDGSNPGEEWELTFTLELLDKAGKVIERATKKASWEEEAKTFNFDHPVLEYVVPMIADVRITIVGRLD
jgi:hypothetical protein